MKIIPRLFMFLPLLCGLVMFSNTLHAGNKELMKQKRLKTLRLNETVIKQIDNLKHNVLISFVGRVVKNKDGTVDILVEKIDKRPIEQEFTIKPNGRYIQYMSFEEMQQLPLPTNNSNTSNFYGGGAPASVR